MEKETGNNESFIRTIDIRGRICVPKQLLEFLGEFFLSVGANHSLILLPIDIARKVLEDNTIIQHNLLRREFCKSLIMAEMDKRNRLIVPRNLLFHMRKRNGGKAQFVRVDNHVELVPINED